MRKGMRKGMRKVNEQSGMIKADARVSVWGVGGQEAGDLP